MTFMIMQLIRRAAGIKRKNIQKESAQVKRVKHSNEENECSSYSESSDEDCLEMLT